MSYWLSKLKEKKMDAVGQADADIDNDGDVDKSDSYLHNRRKAIKKSMKKEELSKATQKALSKASASSPAGKKAVSLPKAPWDKAKKEAYNEPQGQAKSMMSPLQKIRIDKEKADRDKNGKLKKTKLKAAYSCEDTNQEAKQIDEISRSMTPMRNRFGPSVDSKKWNIYKKHMKKHNLDEPTVRMIHQNPDEAESKRMMKNPKYAKAVDMYKNSMKEAYEGVPAAAHKGYQDPQGKGLSPSAKAQLANKTPTPEPLDEPKVDAKNFKDFRKGLKTAAKRKGDNSAGDKAPVK
jgi:hypothetical protein